jgi:hypothetical protein
MAIRTISDTGGNWNATASWVEGVVPTNADDVVATGTSGALTITAAAAAKTIDFTNYTNVFTINDNIELQVSGNITLVSGATYTSSAFTNGGGIMSNIVSGTINFNDQLFDGKYTFRAAATFSSDAYVRNLAWFSVSNINRTGTASIYVNESFQPGGGNLQSSLAGTLPVRMIGTGSLSTNLTLSGGGSNILDYDQQGVCLPVFIDTDGTITQPWFCLGSRTNSATGSYVWIKGNFATASDAVSSTALGGTPPRIGFCGQREMFYSGPSLTYSVVGFAATNQAVGINIRLGSNIRTQRIFGNSFNYYWNTPTYIVGDGNFEIVGSASNNTAELRLPAGYTHSLYEHFVGNNTILRSSSLGTQSSIVLTAPQATRWEILGQNVRDINFQTAAYFYLGGTFSAGAYYLAGTNLTGNTNLTSFEGIVGGGSFTYLS